jgi:hypothetical protein
MTEGQSGTGVVGAANQEVKPGSWVFRMSAYFLPGSLPLLRREPVSCSTGDWGEVVKV